MSDIPVWVGVAVTFVVGVGGWVTAGIANARAKAANVEAAKSNAIAVGAVEKAEQANRIAADANRLSEDANALVGRSVAAQTEDWHVDWWAEWNAASASLELKNRGRDAARDASVTIVGEGVYVVEKWPEGVAPNADAVVLVASVLDLRAQKEARNARIIEGNRSSSVAIIPSPFSVTLSVSVRWRTGEGFPGGQQLEVRAT